MNTLQLRYDVDDDQLTVRPFIDGHDLLADYSNDQGLDPHRLLPPISSVLLPTRDGNVAVIGACSCGQTGCGSLSVHVARVGSEVIWEPEPDPHYETVARTYRFGLQQYLDAVDDAAGDPRRVRDEADESAVRSGCRSVSTTRLTNRWSRSALAPSTG